MELDLYGLEYYKYSTKLDDTMVHLWRLTFLYQRTRTWRLSSYFINIKEKELLEIEIVTKRQEVLNGESM